MTWMPRSWPPPASPSQRNPKVLAVHRESGSTVFSLIAWQAQKPLTRDVTVVCPLADLYLGRAAPEAGSVSELAADRKSAKSGSPISTAGCCRYAPSNQRLCSWISVQRGSQDFSSVRTQAMIRDSSFLFQQISVLIQRSNTILLHDSFAQEED